MKTFDIPVTENYLYLPFGNVNCEERFVRDDTGTGINENNIWEFRFKIFSAHLC